jgi:hypothetical protein
MYPHMHVGTKARRRRHRITKMGIKRHGEFDKLDVPHLEYDSCKHGNATVIVNRTSSVILSLLLISFTGNKLWSPILTK